MCSGCACEPATHRCIECTSTSLFCTSCIVNQHGNTPLHRLEVRREFSNDSFRSLTSNSSGTVASSNVRLSAAWAIVSTLATNTFLAPRRTGLKSLSWWTKTGSTMSTYSSVRARAVLSGSKNTASSYAWVGTLRRSGDRRPPLRSTSSIVTTNSCFKGNSTYTTTTHPLSRRPTIVAGEK